MNPKRTSLKKKSKKKVQKPKLNTFLAILPKDGYTVIGRHNCPYCVQSKEFLQNKQMPFNFIDINLYPMSTVRELSDKYNHFTVPMIFKGKTFIGGYNDLTK